MLRRQDQSQVVHADRGSSASPTTRIYPPLLEHKFYLVSIPGHLFVHGHYILYATLLSPLSQSPITRQPLSPASAAGSPDTIDHPSGGPMDLSFQPHALTLRDPFTI